MSDRQLQHVLACMDRGKIDEAIDRLKNLLGRDPDQALYHGLLATCLVQKLRLHAAQYELGLAIRADPNEAFFYVVQGRIHLLKARYEQASEACTQALALDPRSVEAHLLASRICMLQEKRSEALAHIDAAAQIAPGSLETLLAYGDYHLAVGSKQEALRFAEEALRLEAQNEDANVLMGEVQLALGNVEEAGYHARFAVMNNPSSRAALRLLCNIKMRNNWLLGLWWRFNSSVATLNNLRASLVLIGGFLGFNLLAQIVEDFGYPGTSAMIGLAWLLLVVYSWVGIPMYRKALKRELEKFEFNPKF